MNNAESCPFHFRQQHRTDDLSHSYRFQDVSLPSRLALSALPPHQALSTKQPTLRMSQISPTMSPREHWQSDNISQSQHRESSAHQHSLPSPYRRLWSCPRSHANLLSTRITNFNSRPVASTRHLLRFHVRKARKNMCPMCIVLSSLSLNAEIQKCHQMKC